ncbi:MAG TPA: hypothetical protein VGR07_20665 [Thermoanaerobaculia bacterium]|nr:hypothetical protein [Thermoanaerobaculia bacterium]
MENGKPPLEPALRTLTARLERQLGEHPSPETLAAYHEGRLAAEEGERLRDHVALCADCAQLLLDLTAFPEIEAQAGSRRPTEGEVDEAWEALQARLGESEAAIPNVVRMPQSSPTVSRPQPAYWPWALAASWLVVLGLGLWVVELRRENARLAEPAVNAVVADLTAEGEQVRGGERGSVKISSAAGRAFLDFDAAGLPPHSAYEVEILSGPGTGRALWTGRELKRSRDDHFTLDLQPGFLSPGSYRLRLFGVGDGHREKLADYPFEIGAP